MSWVHALNHWCNAKKREKKATVFAPRKLMKMIQFDLRIFCFRWVGFNHQLRLVVNRFTHHGFTETTGIFIPLEVDVLKQSLRDYNAAATLGEC